MSSHGDVLDEVAKRANLAMSNQMEMLTFFLTDKQLYALNVFKIIEILETPKEITKIPYSHSTIKGNINFRDKAISLIDLGEYLGMEPVDYKNTVSYVLVCEYSTTVQGFLISQPNVLITKSWSDVIKPKGNIYDNSCLTAITYDDDQPIQILDVEKVLNEIIGIDTKVSADMVSRSKGIVKQGHHILALDDSKTACTLIASALNQLNIPHTIVDNAPQALEILEKSIGADGMSSITLIISDLEMPIMDGFTFTRKVRADPKLAKIRLTIHSSLSNKSNVEKATQMGADDFVSKFTPDNIVGSILDQLQKAEAQRMAN